MQIDPTSTVVNGILYDVIQWTPNSIPMFKEAKYLALDTETEMIVDGQPVKPVLLQVCNHEERLIHMVWHTDIDDYLFELFTNNPNSIYIFHNAPFDLNVLGLDSREPVRDVWLSLIYKGRIVDTMLRYLLKSYTEGYSGEKLKAGLDMVALKMLGLKVEKNNDIRLTFKQDMDLTPEHVEYAAKDSAVTAQLFLKMSNKFPTETIQLMGHIALSSIARNGLLVDREYQKNLGQEVKQKLDDCLTTVGLFGYHPGEPGCKGVLQDILLYLQDILGIKLECTEKKAEIKMGSHIEDIVNALTPEQIKDVEGNIHLNLFEAYNAYIHENKMYSTYLDPKHLGADGRVHTYFTPIIKTGRTSSSGPNLQNLPRKEGLRGQYVAPPGSVLYACDYSQLELCALAEHCHITYNESVMREIINQGQDLHRWFGDIIKENDPRPESEKADINYRQMAKAANFGFPGGLGIETFQEYALATYGVVLTPEQCEFLKDLWKDSFPEMRYHLKPMEDPTMRSRDGDTLYLAQTVTGRVRHGATYCSACNYAFQGLAADGAKVAMWYLYMSRFKMVNFIHDEIITELREDDQLQRKVTKIDELMIKGMRRVIKHVDIRVEGALMYRWHKDAAPVYDDDKNLLVWDAKDRAEVA